MRRKPCCDKEGLKKGPWTADEDQKLIDYIHNHGPGNWRTLPDKAGLRRCGKSCRLRWANYLRPDIKRGKFSFEEEDTIIQLHSILGNRWSAIAARLPGRTDNEIKNYYNTHIRKRLLWMGIDPVTHGPRLDYLDIPSLFSTLQNSSSLLNFPAALLNLQNLLNPELLKLATSLASSSQNEVQNSFTQNPLFNNMFVNNTNDQIIQQPIIHNNIPSSSNGLFCSSAEQNSVFISSNNHCNQSFSNGSSFSTPLSSLSSAPVYPLDSAYTYLNSNTSNEDEIDSFFHG